MLQGAETEAPLPYEPPSEWPSGPWGPEPSRPRAATLVVVGTQGDREDKLNQDP